MQLQKQKNRTIGKLASTQATTGAEVDELSTYRLFIKDRNSGLNFLIDTGANISVLPVKMAEKRTRTPENYLYAANGSSIPTYGEKTVNLDLNLRRCYKWKLTTAAVSRPILGADFLRHYDLLVDLHGQRLIDKKTNLSTRGCISSTGESSIRTIDDNQPYHDLLAKYPNITRPSLKETSESEVEHHIVTTGPPVFAKSRPLPPHKYKAAKEEFQSMMEQGICRPSSSPWASPLHMVLKKDGQYRPCGDYRRLNAITVPDRYPIPRLHDFNYELQGKKIYSKLDLRKAYFQLRIKESDIQKTAVITPFGLYEFTRMCFGLRNSAQTFQRHIDEVLRGLPVFPFVDDILVASEDEDQHRKHLEDVFRRLEQNGLQLNTAKCVFGQRNIDFLGYSVSANGISPTDEKTQAITSYPLPSNIQELRRFLGMINFYRNNIPRAAENQKELNQLIHGSKKNDKTKIIWTTEAKKAFEKCKEDIKNATQLSHPIANAPFSLMTDASDTCAGGVLQQRIKNSWKPLAFFSKKFSDAQKKYSTYDRELLSIYMAVRHFKNMFEGRELIIYTDHKPLTYALTSQSKNETPRRARYLEYIGQFTSNIRHISGKENEVADALSRVEEIRCPTPINYEELAKTQEEDAELMKYKHAANLKFEKVTLPYTTAKVTCETSTGKARPYIPLMYRKTVFQTVHNLSHPGIRTTRKMTTDRYFWPAMNRDVSEWTRKCIPCQKAKIQRHTKSPLSQYEPADRLSHVHMDIIGPLPMSDNYRYCLTMIDRATKWPEAYPMEDMSADSVTTTFYNGWISRFGCPNKITTDQGRQFESDMFNALSRRMGIQHTRTTAYHPQANGMIERWHRTLKTALTARLNTTNWARELPTVLLGLRATVKEDVGRSAAELLYLQTLRLPGEFCGEKTTTTTTSHLMSDLSEALRKSQTQRKAASTITTFIHGELRTCTHVFVRDDTTRKPLTPAYNGPYAVIDRTDKFFKVQLPLRVTNISIDRLKPAFTEGKEEKTRTENSDEHITSPKETQPQVRVTASGRVSKPPVRFASGGVM